MAHFVNVPIPRNPGDNGISSLSLKDPSGTCTIGVWGMPPKSSVQASANPRFAAAKSYASGSVQAFFLRGLKAGDEIAAFLPTGERYTSWLPIKFVRGDHNAKARAAGTLPRSANKSSFILDPHGSEQRQPPIKEFDWVKAVENSIATVKANPIGASVLGALTRDITIGPQIKSEVNANSAVTFTPQQFKGNGAGNRADEVLIHELIHVLENNFNGYANAQVDGLRWDGTDFLTVTLTNVYASIAGRTLRAHHSDFGAMPPFYATNAAAFRANQAANFSSVQARMPGLFAAWGATSAPWNPFK